MFLVRSGNTQTQNSRRFASAQCACRGDRWCVSLSLSILHTTNQAVLLWCLRVGWPTESRWVSGWNVIKQRAHGPRPADRTCRLIMSLCCLQTLYNCHCTTLLWFASYLYEKKLSVWFNCAGPNKTYSGGVCFPPRWRELLVGRPTPLEMCAQWGPTISATQPIVDDNYPYRPDPRRRFLPRFCATGNSRFENAKLPRQRKKFPKSTVRLNARFCTL